MTYVRLGGTEGRPSMRVLHGVLLAKPVNSDGRRKCSRALSRNASTPNDSASRRYSGKPKLVRPMIFAPGRVLSARERRTPKPEPSRKCKSRTCGLTAAMRSSASASVPTASIKSNLRRATG